MVRATASVFAFVLAVLLASACSDDASKSRGIDTAPVGADGGDGAYTGNVPMLDTALEGHCPGGKPPENGVAPGNDLRKVTLSAYPNAVCNDGSPAIMYVRRSSAPAAENKWIIHQQAGGSCSNYEVCLDRWCGINYDASKMSSKFAPPATNGSGIFARNAVNSFGPANQVYIYYCSSDTWVGRRSDVVLEDSTGANVPFRLHFRGHDILEAAADALAKGVTSDDGAETLPSLSSATQVLLSGSSAGSYGMTESLDWWASKVPGAKAFGMLDSIFLPLPEDVDDPAVKEKYMAGLEGQGSTRLELYGAFGDESCRAAHPGPDAYLCELTSHVQLNHLTTPFFTRQDYSDPVSYGYLEAAGASLDQVARWTSVSMHRVTEVLNDAEEKAAMTKAPGVYASDCGQHIVMLNGPWFGVAQNGNATVKNDSGSPLTVHDALAGWLTGTTVAAFDTHPTSPTLTQCVQTTKDK